MGSQVERANYIRTCDPVSLICLAARQHEIRQRTCLPPEYPKGSLARNEQGASVVELEVAEDGNVIASNLKRSSGYPALDRATEQAFVGCKFPKKLIDEAGGPKKYVVEYVWEIK